VAGAVPSGVAAQTNVVAAAPSPSPAVAAESLLEKAADTAAAAAKTRGEPVRAAVTTERAAPGDALAAARREEAALAENPAAACSPRTNFALYRCMQNQCEQRRFFTHPQCIRLRVRDEVS
jgi:non-specific serine/threonine protein kinase